MTLSYWCLTVIMAIGVGARAGTAIAQSCAHDLNTAESQPTVEALLNCLVEIQDQTVNIREQLIREVEQITGDLNAKIRASDQRIEQLERMLADLRGEIQKTAPPSQYQPRDEFPDCGDCPLMVVVPAGSFTMGSPPAEAGRESDEGPQHEVTIAQPFAVSKYEVTFDEWDACVVDGGCYQAGDEGWGRGRQPVINVSWDDAQAYVAWLGKETGQPYRLLSEAEWEYVARAGTRTAYWWGDDIGSDNANCDGCGNRSYDKTAPVGTFPPNHFGLQDTAGNVWEWVQDCWHPSYDKAPPDASAWITGGDCNLRAMRGAAWDSKPRILRSADRERNNAHVRNSSIGFRVARTLD